MALLRVHGKDGLRLWRKYGDDAVDTLQGRVVRVGADQAEALARDLEQFTGAKAWYSSTSGRVYTSRPTDDALEAARQLKEVLNRGDEAQTGMLIEQIAVASTRGEGDRVVLGAWREGGGYIGEGLDGGGIFFDTGQDVWDQIKASGIDLWLINEAFLTKQLDVGVERIEFVGEDITDIITSPDTRVRNSFRAKEIRWLLENMEEYGYVLDGNIWVRR